MGGSLRERSPRVREIRLALGRDPLTGNYRTVSRTVHGGKRKAREETALIVSAAANGKYQGTRANVRFLTDRWLEHLERLGPSGPLPAGLDVPIPPSRFARMLISSRPPIGTPP
jgi:hypothetical protein